MDGRWNALERQHVERMTTCSAVGSPESVNRQLTKLLEATKADELIVAGPIENHAARLRSYELIADLQKKAV